VSRPLTLREENAIRRVEAFTSADPARPVVVRAGHILVPPVEVSLVRGQAEGLLLELAEAIDAAGGDSVALVTRLRTRMEPPVAVPEDQPQPKGRFL
jgi:hypothetical protein